jgi:hypothetical protein
VVLADALLELGDGLLVRSQSRERRGALGVTLKRGVRGDADLVVTQPVQAVMLFEVFERVLDAPPAGGCQLFCVSNLT